MQNYQIVVTNDDGIESPGLRAAAEAVAPLGEVIIVAPSHQQTGMGRSLTGDLQASLEPVEYLVNGEPVEAYHCACSPALVVRHSLRTLLHQRKIDLLVSGINYGENLGTNVTCSGTVGAALEGAAAGIPSIAMSKQTEIESHHRYSEQDWAVSGYFLHYFARQLLLQEGIPEVDILKVDVPGDATTLTPWKLCRLARTSYYSKVFDSPGAGSRISDARTVIEVDPESLDPDTDIYVLAVDRLVSVTPMSLDFTSRVNFGQLRETLAAEYLTRRK